MRLLLFAGLSAALVSLLLGPVEARPLPATMSAPIASSSPPALKTLYFNKKGYVVASPDSADHREELVYRDSLGGIARIYYPSGKLRRLVPYLDFDHGTKHGIETGFYETGEIKSRAEYQAGEMSGPYVQFYRDGKVRSRSYLQGDKAQGEVKSELFLPDGSLAPASFELDKLPTYGGGGTEAIVAAIQRRVQYPVEALRQQLQGRVMVRFLVDDAGFIRNVRIIDSPSPVFNYTVMRAVVALGRLAPGKSGSDPVEVFYTLPVTFAIR